MPKKAKDLENIHMFYVLGNVRNTKTAVTIECFENTIGTGRSFTGSITAGA
jgi:hypothetical protein